MVEWMELVERVCLILFCISSNIHWIVLDIMSIMSYMSIISGYWTNYGRQSLHISGVQKRERQLHGTSS